MIYVGAKLSKSSNKETILKNNLMEFDVCGDPGKLITGGPA